MPVDGGELHGLVVHERAVAVEQQTTRAAMPSDVQVVDTVGVEVGHDGTVGGGLLEDAGLACHVPSEQMVRGPGRRQPRGTAASGWPGAALLLPAGATSARLLAGGRRCGAGRGLGADLFGVPRLFGVCRSTAVSRDASVPASPSAAPAVSAALRAISPAAWPESPAAWPESPVASPSGPGCRRLGSLPPKMPDPGGRQTRAVWDRRPERPTAQPSASREPTTSWSSVPPSMPATSFQAWPSHQAATASWLLSSAFQAAPTTQTPPEGEAVTAVSRTSSDSKAGAAAWAQVLPFQCSTRGSERPPMRW